MMKHIEIPFPATMLHPRFKNPIFDYLLGNAIILFFERQSTNMLLQ